MENNELSIASNIIIQGLHALDALIDGKLTQRTLDLGSHEMFIETREKKKRVNEFEGESVVDVGEIVHPPPIPEHLKQHKVPDEVPGSEYK